MRKCPQGDTNSPKTRLSLLFKYAERPLRHLWLRAWTHISIIRYNILKYNVLLSGYGNVLTLLNDKGEVVGVVTISKSKLKVGELFKI